MSAMYIVLRSVGLLSLNDCTDQSSLKNDLLSYIEDMSIIYLLYDNNFLGKKFLGW